VISVENFPKAEFPAKFFSQLAKMEEKPHKEEEENADPNANGKGGRRRSSVLRRQSYVEQPPEDPVMPLIPHPQYEKCGKSDGVNLKNALFQKRPNYIG
jgi:hypothetical protein